MDGRFAVTCRRGPRLRAVSRIGTGAARVDVAAGERREITIDLRRTGSIEGTVVREDGEEPCNEAEVRRRTGPWDQAEVRAIIEEPGGFTGSERGTRGYSFFGSGGDFAIGDVPRGSSRWWPMAALRFRETVVTVAPVERRKRESFFDRGAGSSARSLSAATLCPALS